MFYSFRGVLDNFSVPAYAPASGKYMALSHYTDWVQIVPLRQEWYLCAAI